MISFITPEDQFDTRATAARIAKAHAAFTDAKITEALIKLHGTLPDEETIVKHCKCFVERRQRVALRLDRQPRGNAESRRPCGPEQGVPENQSAEHFP